MTVMPQTGSMAIVAATVVCRGSFASVVFIPSFLASFFLGYGLLVSADCNLRRRLFEKCLWVGFESVQTMYAAKVMRHPLVNMANHSLLRRNRHSAYRVTYALLNPA